MTYEIVDGIFPQKLLAVIPAFGVMENVFAFCWALAVSVINTNTKVNIFVVIFIFIFIL